MKIRRSEEQSPSAPPRGERAEKESGERPATARHSRAAQGTATARHLRRAHRTAHAQPAMTWAAAGLVLAGIGFLLLFAWAQWERSSGVAFYETLDTQAVAAALESAPAPEAGGTACSVVNFAMLCAQNPDTAAWLEVPGIGLSLPVTHTVDDRFYLNHRFDGAQSSMGCLFLAAENAADWSSLYNVVYGHNLRSGKMFGELDAYAEQSFYEQSPTFWLYTPQKTYLCRIFSCHNEKEGSEVYTNSWQPGEEYDAFVQRLVDASVYDTGVAVELGSRVLTLSTCRNVYGSKNRRFVVHAVMEPVDGIAQSAG